PPASQFRVTGCRPTVVEHPPDDASEPSTTPGAPSPLGPPGQHAYPSAFRRSDRSLQPGRVPGVCRAPGDPLLRGPDHLLSRAAPPGGRAPPNPAGYDPRAKAPVHVRGGTAAAVRAMASGGGRVGPARTHRSLPAATAGGRGAAPH